MTMMMTMANDDVAQQENVLLQSTEAIPIAQLHQGILDPKSRVVDGVVTITWPYSLVTKSIAFILAEHDPLLRRDNGQVRVELHGAAGRAFSGLGVGGGDGVRLSLDGVEWEENKAPMKRPGMLEGQMKFTNRLVLNVRKIESQELDTINIDAPDEEGQESQIPHREMSATPPIDITEPNYSTPLTGTPLSSIPAKRLASAALDPGEYASPAFLKRARVSYGSLFEDGFDIFDEDEPRKDKKRRKSRFSMGGASWRYSSRSPSPEVEQVSDYESEAANGSAEVSKVSDVAEQQISTPERPPMIDQGCQTKELELSPSRGVQVIAESRSNGVLLDSTPTPAWKHAEFSSAFQEPPALLFDPAAPHIDSSVQSVIVDVHAAEPPAASAFGLPINIDPSLQFHTVDAVNQPVEYPMTTAGFQPHESTFAGTHPQPSIDWATGASASTSPYPTIPTHSFAGYPEEMIDTSLSARRDIAGPYDENAENTARHEYIRAPPMEEAKQTESTSDEESEARETYPHTPNHHDIEVGGQVAPSTTQSSPQEVESTEESDEDESTEESEEDYDDGEEGNWDSRMRVYDASENGYDEDEDEDGYDHDTENEYDEDDEESASESEPGKDDEEQEEKPVYRQFLPIPRPAPPPSAPKEPVFISLLSDSEDDDNTAAAPKDAETKDEPMHHAEEEEDQDGESTENEESEDEEMTTEVTQVEGPDRTSSDRSRSISQLDGCDDYESDGHPMYEDIKNHGMDPPADVDDMELVPTNEAHQTTKPADAATDDIHNAQGVTSSSHDDNEDKSGAREQTEPMEQIEHTEQTESMEQDQSPGTATRNMPIRGAVLSKSPEPPNAGAPAVQDNDMETTVSAIQNSNPLDVAEAVEPVAEIVSDISHLPEELPTEVLDVKVTTVQHTDEPAEATEEKTLEPRIHGEDEEVTEERIPEPRSHEEVEERKPESENENEGKDSTEPQDVEMRDDEQALQLTDRHGIQQQEEPIPLDEATRTPVSKNITDAVPLAAPSSPPATQTEHPLPIPVAEAASALGRQESAKQLPTPGETQTEDVLQPDLQLLLEKEIDEVLQPNLQLPLEKENEDEDDNDDMAASQQLMSEFVHYSSPQKPKDTGHVCSDASHGIPHRTEVGHEETPRRAKQKPDLVITSQSLRSHCRSKRQSLDSSSELSMDPSLSGRSSPTMAQFCLLNDVDPIVTALRAARSSIKTDQPDPSLALAKASEAQPDEGRRLSGPLRIIRGKSDGNDPSLLLAQSYSPPLGNSPRKPVSPPVILRAGRRRSDKSDPSLQLAGASPKSTGSQPAISSPLRGNTPDSVATRGNPGSPLKSPMKSPLKSPLKSPSIASSVAEDATVSTLKSQLLKNLRTTLPDHLPLKSLRMSLNKTVDILAVATATPEQPHRPKHGPRDYMLKLTLTDPSVAPATVNAAHIFRPHQASLPVIHAGDIVLLRRMQVVSMHGRGFGVRAGDVSAWAVFEKGDEEMLPQIKGPPVEVTSEEIEYAQGLGRWWNLQDGRALAKIAKATQKLSQASREEAR